MKPIYLFPGTFCPPTYGHLDIVKQVSILADKVYIICTDSILKKDRWFNPEQCKTLWESYRLPKNCEVYTLSEFTVSTKSNYLKKNPDKVVLVRGIRDINDFYHEKNTIDECKVSYNIHKFMIVYSRTHLYSVSSTNARILAECLNIEKLAEYASPRVVGMMLEYVLQVRNIFIVVGKPGSGKSTLLKMLESMDVRNMHINVDLLHDCFKEKLETYFPGKNLHQAMKEDENLVITLVKSTLLSRISQKLMEIPPGKQNLFIEIAYAFDHNKEAFRYIGGKVIYLWCKSNKTRVIKRGTPHLLSFISKIHGKRKTQAIANRFKLKMYSFDTTGDMKKTERLAEKINEMTAYSIWD